MRFTFVFLIGAILFMAGGCRHLQFDQPTALQDSDWVTDGRTPARTNAAELTLTPPLEPAWTYNATAGFGPGSPLLVGNMVLVPNRKGELHGIRADTGKRIGLTRFGASIEGTPVSDGKRIYVPVAWEGRALQAYDLATGNVVWSVKHTPVDAGLLLQGGRLFSADVTGVVRAYDTANGQEVWKYTPATPATVKAGLAMTETGHLIVADGRGRLTSLDAGTGAVHWQMTGGASVRVTPAVHGGLLYVATTRGKLMAINAIDGSAAWQFAVTDSTVYLSSPAVGNGLVLIGGSDGTLRALDAGTGEEKWSFSVDEALTAAPLVTERTIYVAGLGQKIYGLAPESGKVIWSGELRGRVKSAMAVRDGLLVVLAEPNFVQAFRPASAVAAR